MSLDKLKVDELRVLASEGFAVEVPEGANKQSVLAQLVENGVTYESALGSPFFPERLRPIVEEPVTERPVVTSATLKGEESLVSAGDGPDRRSVVTSADIRGTETVAPVEVVGLVVEEPVRITPRISVPDKVLLKMDRENPRYDIRGYKFTKAHPFVLVNEKDAEYITENIEGFKYASPKEAREFYG